MKILSASQIRSADTFTIQHEPVASIDLMERAASACKQWLIENCGAQKRFHIFCGPGNNGGDGLAIARLLRQAGRDVTAFVIHISENYSPDFLENRKRLEAFSPDIIHEIRSIADFPKLKKGDVVVDAIFGTGLSKPATGIASDVIKKINAAGAFVIAIDIPSGLFADSHTESSAVVQANHTLSFQLPKLAFMFPENEKFTGEWHLLDIRLNQEFITRAPSASSFITEEFIHSFLKPRKKFSHKGNYGHAFIAAGSKGKMGAAVLCAKACLRSGAGLLTMVVPEAGYRIMQTSCPEAMVETGNPDLKKYSAVGIGPGLGTDARAVRQLKKILTTAKVPLVLDADALNMISAGKKNLLKLVPQDSIFTPHVKEFQRLAGKSANDFERHEKQILFSKKNKVIVVLKGAHTCITTPEGQSYFNSTGNPGMAKGGSGDVLTGILTSIMAQGYSSKEAAILGVYLHGLAGDVAASGKGKDGMIAGDIVDMIPEAWKKLRTERMV